MTAAENHRSASVLLILALSIAIPYSAFEISIWLSIAFIAALIFLLIFDYRENLFKHKKFFLALNILVLLLILYVSFSLSSADQKVGIIVAAMIASLQCVTNGWFFSERTTKGDATK